MTHAPRRISHERNRAEYSEQLRAVAAFTKQTVAEVEAAIQKLSLTEIITEHCRRRKSPVDEPEEF